MNSPGIARVPTRPPSVSATESPGPSRAAGGNLGESCGENLSLRGESSPQAPPPVPEFPVPVDRSSGEESAAAASILLIDDDPAVALGLAKLLERHGCPVQLASNGMTALRLLDDPEIKLVITDIYMDGMDGLETIMCLRKRRPDLPVIAISGGSPKMPIDCLQMARSLGAVCVMSKPLRIAPLLKVIRQLAPELAPPEPGSPT